MGGWAPRALEETVRPRRESGACARPFNFTVRRRVGRPRQHPGLDASPTGAVCGSNCRRVLLLRRCRSIATAMIALGFAATLVSLASGLFVTYRTHAVLVDLTSAPQARQDTFFVVAHYHRFLPTLGLLGIWVAAAGTLWHVKRRH